jgi:mRNA interferase RelE/StbE
MAKRQLAKLNNAIVRRLQVKIDALAENTRPHGYIKLKGFENRYRIRVGEYRVIYEIHDNVLLVLIARLNLHLDHCIL